MSDFSTISRSALLEHRRKQLEDGYLFPLTATSIGMDEVLKARVRRLTILDRAAIESLPQHVQQAVWEGNKEAERMSKQMAGQDPQSLIESATKNETILPAANAWAIASFIEPRLVATEPELSGASGAWVVDDIAAEDRVSFFLACMDADSTSARQLKLFRPKTPGHVPTGTVVPMATPTVGPAGAAS